MSTATPATTDTSRGWTVRSGAWDILAPSTGTYGGRCAVKDGRPTDEHVLLTRIGPAQADALLKALPADALSERHNLGPSLGACLRACAASSGRVLLSGYGISPARPDERITIDTVWVQGEDVAGACLGGAHGPDCQCQEVWETIKDRYNLDARCVPDEIRHEHRDLVSGPVGVSMWWD